MSDFYETVGGWEMELEFKPNFDDAVKRVYAWLEGQETDRPPLRFSRHNAEYEAKRYERHWSGVKERWFDTEFVVGSFIGECQNRRFNAETFPVFWPNLGPNVFAACCEGVKYEFGDVTAWTHFESDGGYGGDFDYTPPKFKWDSEYFKKLDEMTEYALAECKGRFMVGYTDIHPGMDWIVAVKGNDAALCGLYENPDGVAAMMNVCQDDFFTFYDHFDAKLKAAGQMSVTWMNIPAYGKLHIPSSDFSSMISPAHYMEFVHPVLVKECAHMTHNIFHVDGKGVARHTDAILTLPNLKAIQWVHGVGDDAPIMQWVPYIKKIQDSGKGVIVDITVEELELFMREVSKKGLFLCIPTESEEQEQAIIKRVMRWG